MSQPNRTTVTVREMHAVPTPAQPWQVRETVPGFRAARKPNPESETRIKRVDPRAEPEE